MTAFLMGAGGFLASLALFFGGFCAGWRMRGLRGITGARTAPPPPDERELRRRREEEAEQEALRALQRYSAQDAYGIGAETTAGGGM